MNQTQATVTLAVDFSLEQLDVALRSPTGAWLWPHQAYHNNWLGYQNLKAELLAALQAYPSAQLRAVGESTGPYWWHLFYQLCHDADLAAYAPQVAVLNPKHVKRFRQALPEADKTDQLDPQLIGHYDQTLGGQATYGFNERYLPLRSLSRAYYRLIHTLAAEKAFLLSVLYLWASDYQGQQPFSDLFGVSSQHILTELPDIQALADLDLASLTEQLVTLSQGTLPDPAHNAQRLKQVAELSYPIPPELAASLHQVIQLTLAHIRFLADNQKAYRQLIEQQLNRLPEAQLARDYRGLGPILVAGCLSEIQTTSRFTTGTKFDRRRQVTRPRTYRDGQAAVAKLAGLWWPQNASGHFQAQDLPLAQERNPYLRYWFVQAAHTLQRYQPDYRTFYWRKYQQARHHQHKRALLLTARKAVRLIFALLHKGQQAGLKEVAAAST